MNIPYTVIFEKRTDDYPKWLPAVTSLGSVVVAFIISGIILEIIGGDSLRVLKFFFSATFGSWAVFSDTMVKATPLILVGLACAVAFKMKLWNIGAEGQFYMGAFFSSLVVLVPMVNLETTPKFIVIALMMIMGMIGGAIWGFIPGYLKAKFKSTRLLSRSCSTMLRCIGITSGFSINGVMLASR